MPPTDEFGPNPQDRFSVIDPTKNFPAGFTPAMGDPDDANTTLQGVADDTQKLIQGGAPLNEVVNTLLGTLGFALGASKVIGL